MITKELLLETMAHFTWGWGQDFFIETEHGNFHWKSPDYEGANTMTLFEGSYEDWCKKLNIDFGRDKGHHNIERKCGTEFTLIIPELISKADKPQEVKGSKVGEFLQRLLDCQKLGPPYGGWDLTTFADICEEYKREFHIVESPPTPAMALTQELVACHTDTGWIVNEMSKVSIRAREYLGLPSIYDLNPLIAKTKEHLKQVREDRNSIFAQMNARFKSKD